MEDPPGEPGLVRTALRQTNSVAAGHPLWFAIGIGVAGVALVLAGFDRLPGPAWLGAVLTLAATLLVILAIFLVQLLAAHVRAEVRSAVDTRLGPREAPGPDPADFACDRDASLPASVAGVRVTNRGPAGTFSARVTAIEGLAAGLGTPWAIRWQGETGERIEIGRNASRTLEVAEVRSIRRIDFYRARGGRDHESAAAACAEAKDSPCEVGVDIEVQNEIGDRAGTRAVRLEMALREDGSHNFVVVHRND